MKKVFRYPLRYTVSWLQQHHFLDKLSDRVYCSWVMFARTGEFPNYKNPIGFNEKLQWLKLYNRKPELTTLVDKYTAKKYVADKLGNEYVAKLLFKWDSVNEIDINLLPNRFVIKCSHDGGVFVCKDKNSFNFSKIKHIIEDRLKVNYYDHAREWPYKNIKPCIVAEEYLEDYGNENLPVYKFLCFSGKPRIIQTIQNDKHSNESVDYFDLNWNSLEIEQNYPNSKIPLPKPKNLKKMIEIATTLCEGHPFIRVDLYQVNDRVVFSEFTLFSDAGFEAFEPKRWDVELGKWIMLPPKYLG